MHPKCRSFWGYTVNLNAFGVRRVTGTQNDPGHEWMAHEPRRQKDIRGRPCRPGLESTLAPMKQNKMGQIFSELWFPYMRHMNNNL